MEISEFIEATSRIENYFGKEYTTEQRRIMYEELKTMNIERYRQLITAVIRKSKYLPKIADFIEADKELPRERKEENKTTECNICNGTGYIDYKKIIGESRLVYDYACRCICENGLRHNHEIPTFQELGIKPNEEIYVKEW